MSVLEYLFVKYHSRAEMTYNEKRVLSYLSLYQARKYNFLCRKYWDTMLINSI